jgi:predicted Fe-Mo cluster-binding NifX family protein
MLFDNDSGSSGEKSSVDHAGSCRIAIPLENGLLCPHFGHCEQFAVIHVEHGKLMAFETYNPPEHVPGLYPRWLAGLKVTDVIAGGIGQKAIELFNQQGVNVFAGAPLKPAKDLAHDFLEGRLQLQANYCNHDSKHASGNGGCKRH